MNRISLTSGLSLSRIVFGQMRMAEWKLSHQQMLAFTEEIIDLGISTFDQADIYGNYSCEALMGNVIKLNKSLRDKIEIITKCGIKLKSDKFPERKIKYYDYSFNHILSSVENSLKNLNTEHIDVLLMHRPSPFFDPEEVAKAFSLLKKQGKVLHFGVSNFTPLQFEMLSAYTEEKLVTNQVEISPYCLEHFENGNIDFFLKVKIKPMSWSPMAGGKLLNPDNDKGIRILNVIKEVASELNASSLDEVIYCWVLLHPAGILPIVGTGKIERIKYAVNALTLSMSLEQWFRIYTASTGKTVA